MIGVSFLTPRQVRRASFLLLGISIMLMIATLFIGAEVKGSRRWITLAGISIQPSELLKPAFVVITAWLFAENARRPEIPGNLFSIILFGIVAALLLAQPDFGQTMLVAIVWGALFFMAGMPWLWIVGLGATGAGGLAAAYAFFPHVAGRIDRFITGEGDNFQVETAREAIINGGWLGQGPGEGTVKRIIPDSHADFPFAVAAEEFGIIACILLVALFAFIVLRGLNHALREKDPYVRLAVCGPDHAVRHPVDDQHDGQPATHAGQGHDAAVHFLWRLVAALDGDRHGLRARADAPAAGDPFERTLRLRAAPVPAGGRGRQRMKSRGAMVLCAGGTGGHLFPAEALAHELAVRGWDVHLATDERARQYASQFPARKMHVIASSTPSGKNPFRLAMAAITLLHGYRQARQMMLAVKPAAAIGFGGYPTVPPMLAATRLGIPSMIHDANAVMGRANKLLAPRVDLIAMGFEGVGGGDVAVTGNPVRPAVIEAAKSAYPVRKADEPFNLLVFGGSQGAQFFSKALPQAIELMAPQKRGLLRIVQQARAEDEAALKADYARLAITAEIAPFFTRHGAKNSERALRHQPRRGIDRVGTCGYRPARAAGAVSARAGPRPGAERQGNRRYWRGNHCRPIGAGTATPCGNP